VKRDHTHFHHRSPQPQNSTSLLTILRITLTSPRARYAPDSPVSGTVILTSTHPLDLSTITLTQQKYQIQYETAYASLPEPPPFSNSHVLYQSDKKRGIPLFPAGTHHWTFSFTFHETELDLPPSSFFFRAGTRDSTAGAVDRHVSNRLAPGLSEIPVRGPWMTMAFVVYDLDATAAGFERALIAREVLSFCPGRLLDAPESQASSKIQRHVRRVGVSIPSAPSAAASGFLTKLKSTMRSTKAPSYGLNLTLRVLAFVIVSEALLPRLSFRRAANSLTPPHNPPAFLRSFSTRIHYTTHLGPQSQAPRTDSPICKQVFKDFFRGPSQTGPLSSCRASPPTSNSFLHLPPRKRPKGEHRGILAGVRG
jgi:hypothetical protein